MFVDPSVKRISVDTDKVKGEFFIPVGPGKHPAILLLAGNAGGIASQLAKAQLLASHGYAVLLQAYFRYPGLSAELYEVPLETFAEGVRWLREQTSVVDAMRIAALAPSKGAEGILAAASYIEELDLRAIVAVSPSNVVWQGIGRGKPEDKSSWSLHGKALPYVAYRSRGMLPQVVAAKVVRKLKLEKVLFPLTRTTLSSVYSAVKQHSREVKNATLPVNNIKAPLLLIAGDDDKLWPSKYMANKLLAKRKGTPCAEHDEYYHYPDAGHVFNVPYQPCTIPWMVTPGGKMIINFGGKSKGNAEAQEDAWFKMLTFLAKHLVITPKPI